MHAQRKTIIKRRVAAIGGAIAMGALGVAGCGSSSGGTATSAQTKTVDDAQVEQGIEASLSTSSAKVAGARCPSDVPVQKGDTFSCTVTFSDGATGKATVTQKGAGKYSYELTPGSVQIPGSAADAAVEESLAAQGITGATVTCPENIIVKVGTTVTCNVSGAQGVTGGTVTFTFSDAEGDIDTSSVTTS
jgi:hypothetical protein